MVDSQPLNAGDLVLICQANYFKWWNGCIGTLITPLCWRNNCLDLNTNTRHSFLGYRVRLPDGKIVSAKPEQVIPLRRYKQEGGQTKTISAVKRGARTKPLVDID